MHFSSFFGYGGGEGEGGGGGGETVPFLGEEAEHKC